MRKDGNSIETQCNSGLDKLESQRGTQTACHARRKTGRKDLAHEGVWAERYESYVYFNFDEEDELKSIFETNKNPHRIIELLSMISGEKSFRERH